MRKILSLIFLPLIALCFLYGCGNDGEIESLKNLYAEMTNVYVFEGDNIFFSDETKPNTITIAYADYIDNAISIEEPNTTIQKRYRAFYYEQLMLNNIFNLYENHQENFYKVMSSAEYKSKDVEKLYEKLNNLKSSLTEFKTSYNLFIEQTQEGLSDVLDINLKNYTFELNKVVENSLDFIYEFARVYEKYCIDDINVINQNTLNYRIDKSYLNLTRIIYLENFKTFSIAVADRGVCDISSLIGLESKFNLLDDLKLSGKLSTSIVANLDPSTTHHINAMNLVNDYIYAYKLFDQNCSHYINTYNDIYNSKHTSTNQYNDYRLGLIGGGSLESFVNGLSVTDRSKVNLLTNFIDECYTTLVEKLKLIVE